MSLRELRETAGLSRNFVADKLDVCVSCIAHWEKGDWPPSRKYHKKLAKLYGVSKEQIGEITGRA